MYPVRRNSLEQVKRRFFHAPKVMHKVPYVVSFFPDHPKYFTLNCCIHLDRHIKFARLSNSIVLSSVHEKNDARLRWLPTVLVQKCIVAVETLPFPRLS